MVWSFRLFSGKAPISTPFITKSVNGAAIGSSLSHDLQGPVLQHGGVHTFLSDLKKLPDKLEAEMEPANRHTFTLETKITLHFITCSFAP